MLTNDVLIIIHLIIICIFSLLSGKIIFVKIPDAELLELIFGRNCASHRSLMSIAIAKAKAKSTMLEALKSKP